MADRIVLMRDGSIVQSGTASELYAHPESAFATAFFGEVNMLEGVAQGGAVATPMGTLAAPYQDGVQVRVYVRPEGLHLMEEIGGEGIHALPAKQDEITATGDGDLDDLVGVGTVDPVSGAVGLHDGKGELGRAGEVFAVYGHLARIGDGVCHRLRFNLCQNADIM